MTKAEIVEGLQDLAEQSHMLSYEVACLQAAIAALSADGRCVLSDKEIENCMNAANASMRKHSAAIKGQQLTQNDSWNWHFARAIEQAHGIVPPKERG